MKAPKHVTRDRSRDAASDLAIDGVRDRVIGAATPGRAPSARVVADLHAHRTAIGHRDPIGAELDADIAKILRRRSP